MLSPKAMNLVTEMCGGGSTTTEKAQVLVRCSASVAVQLTGVEPRTNVEPDAGVHAIVTGGVPSATVGVNSTAAVRPSRDVTCRSAGHVSVGATGFGGGGVGEVGEPPHAASVTVETTRTLLMTWIDRAPAPRTMLKAKNHTMQPMRPGVSFT